MDKKELERPLECSECKRPIAISYTEVIGKNVTRFGMCEECPVLRSKLYGQTLHPESPTSLCCGACGLTLEEVRMGASLGCPLCYEIFADEITKELIQLERIPPKYAKKQNSQWHCGRIPGQQQELDPSLKLLALQKALSDTLGREDYEQAARLRDQIRALEKEKKKGQKRGKRK